MLSLGVIFIHFFKEDDVMWVEKQKNGKHKFVERYLDHMTGEERKVSVTLEKDNKATRKQAYEILQQKIKEKNSESQNPQKKLKLFELCEKYLEEQKATVKPQSYNAAVSICKMLQQAIGREIIVDRLTMPFVKKKFRETGKSNITLNNYRVRFFCILRWGYTEGLISRPDWTEKFKPFPVEETYKERIEDKFLEGEEVRKILSSMENTLYRYITNFLVLSGVRIGEALEIRLKDLNFKERILYVHSSYSSSLKAPGSTKTPAGMRKLYMQDDLYKLCKEMVSWNKKEQLLYGYRTDLLFNEFGEHIIYQTYEKYLKKTCLEVIQKPVTSHYFRHTHASLLLEQGIDCDTVSRRLGHTDSRFTREIYIHITKKRKELENEKIKEVRII